MPYKVHFTIISKRLLQMCSYDVLSFRDGVNENSAWMKDGLCGSNIPKPITSTGNEFLIRFRSDSIESRKGFKMIITAGIFFTISNTFILARIIP